MEGFTYSDIFETKGIEYLVIIAFLIILIPFWIMLNKPAIAAKIKKGLGVLSENILRIPQGLFFSRNHTWSHLEKSGNAYVGLDDFLLHMTGSVNISYLKNPGDMVRKGEALAEINQNGKVLKIHSPVSGEILKSNHLLIETPETLNDDPYDKGWVYKIKPSNWIPDISSCYVSEDATNWSKNEMARFKDFLSVELGKNSAGTAFPILLDGGQITDNPLSDLSAEIWQDFQKDFLNQVE
jgi:glycine cleavage system H protein